MILIFLSVVANFLIIFQRWIICLCRYHIGIIILFILLIIIGTYFWIDKLNLDIGQFFVIFICRLIQNNETNCWNHWVNAKKRSKKKCRSKIVLLCNVRYIKATQEWKEHSDLTKSHSNRQFLISKPFGCINCLDYKKCLSSDT